MSAGIYPSSVPLGGWTVPRAVFKRLQTVSGPAALPLDLAVLKAHLRVTHATEDSYLSTLIEAATEMVENYLSRRLIQRTVRMWLDCIPGTGNDFTSWGAGVTQAPVAYANMGQFRWFDLLGLPVTAFASVTSIADDGSESVMDTGLYLIDREDPDQPARVILQRGATWPTTLRVAKSIRADYTLGYGAAASAVPASLRHGVMLIAAALWSNRGDNADAQPDVLALPSIRAALDPYRILRVSTL